MKGKLLLFGFEDLFSAPAIIAAVEPLGLEVVRVPREDYGRKLEELAGLTPRKAKGTPYAGGPLGDKMIVLCGLGNQLDELLLLVQHHADTAQHADLRGGQTHAAGFGQRVRQIVQQRMQTAVKVRHRTAHLGQAGFSL